MGSRKENIRKLFTTFFRIGAFTFGGGYAMIPLIQKEIVEQQKWISEEELLEVVAIAESTPGPIAINAATFVGYRVAGFWGAFAATVGVSLPSFFIILAISGILQAFEQFQPVADAFVGIRAAVLALILSTAVTMLRGMKKNAFNIIVAAAAFAAVAFAGINAFVVLLACAAAGLLLSLTAAGRCRRVQAPAAEEEQAAGNAAAGRSGEIEETADSMNSRRKGS